MVFEGGRVPVSYLARGQELYLRSVDGRIGVQGLCVGSVPSGWVFDKEDDILIAVVFWSRCVSCVIVYILGTEYWVAHVHHAWEIYNRYGRTRDALRRAVLAVCTYFYLCALESRILISGSVSARLHDPVRVPLCVSVSENGVGVPAVTFTCVL